MKINLVQACLLFLLMTPGLAMDAQTGVSGSSRTAVPANPRYPIIPYPTSLTPAEGECILTPASRLVLTGASPFEKEAAVLNLFFMNAFGHPLKRGAAAGQSSLELKYDAGVTAEEGYRLVITPGQVLLSARTTAGMFMGVQTIRQLLPAWAEHAAIHPATQLTLPAVTIEDAPVYAWRGMHLDVSRHFFSIGYLKKFIDVMALYKFNKFHLHLTDDQGWRIEIKKYPKLTEYGAWRTFNNQDSACMLRAAENPDFVIDPTHIIHKDGKTLYGGFYTQDEMKALVAYAAGKHIDIIPEIDMPGHMMAAINQYNYLSCDGSSVFGQLFSTPICPCLPSTFGFAKDVFTEIMNIFPSTYIHIGGDEVDRSLWAKSPACKALMQQEGLKNTAELQSYFINNMEKFFNAHGRKMIGWDEILEGGVSKTAAIMYWRSWVPKAPVEAAKNGNPVIMTPGNPLYFDAIPDPNSLSNVYQFNPIPRGLTDAEAQNIIGAQANIWTEMIPTEARADYMYMPRMTALAEVLWTHHKDYTSYLARLRSNFGRLDLLKVHYRLPDLPGLFLGNVFTDQDTLWVEKPLESLTIRYTTDSSAPTVHSNELSAPLIIRQTQTIRIAAFRGDKVQTDNVRGDNVQTKNVQTNNDRAKNVQIDNVRGDIYTLHYQKQALAEPVAIVPAGDGLICSLYLGSFKMTTAMPDSKPDTVLTVSSIEVPKAAEAPAFGLKFRGYLDIPQDGIYGFYYTCDDGGTLAIAGREVIDNDGNHAPLEKTGQVALKKGLQKIVLNFVEGGGGYTFKLHYSFGGSEPRDVPSSWLKH